MWRISLFLKNVFCCWTALGRMTKILLCAFLCVPLFIAATSPPLNWFQLEKDKKAPVDYGYGVSVPIGSPRPKVTLGKTPAIPKKSMLAAPKGAGGAPIGGGAGGYFGPAFPWPIIPIHLALLPDGRVLNFGTDQTGAQGAQLVYDVWDPKLGNGLDAHTILPNTTATDIFCGGASLLDGSGNVLITGGDLTVNGVRNFSQNKVNIFNPAQNTLTPSQQMNYARWYASITTLPNGDKLELGGSLNGTNNSIGDQTPEVRSATLGWRTLPGISIDPTEWYYPRGFVGSDGAVYVLQQNRQIIRLTTDGQGTLQDTGGRLDWGKYFEPSLMHVDGKGNPFSVLSVRDDKQVQEVDISTNPPTIARVGSLAYDRKWGNATLLPDGEVLVSGGSEVLNELTNVAYPVELYNSSTGTWTLGASAAIPRLYHSATLLLPDGSVLTGGGGAPGPVNELNAEIYYPPYLYLKDGSGNPAPRPQIISAPTTALNLNQNFLVTVGASDIISKINLIRLGANTHSFNAEQRLIPLPFSQSGTQITATLNASAKLAPPGYYMLFVFNSSGVPAVAKTISIAQTFPDLIPTSISYSSATGAFTSVVSNQGDVPTPAGVPIGVSYSVDGTKCSWGAVDGPLAAGATVTIGSQGGSCVIPNGTHTITVFADDVNRMAETNKTNNTLSQTITIGGAPLPDLVPTSISYSSATGAFTSVVSNQGGAPTPAGVPIGVSYSVDGAKCTWGAVDGPLAAGATVTIGSQGGSCVIPNGTHTISVFADNVNSIAESNETNNTLSQTIVLLPDLVPTSISYSSATGAFTSVVSNQGAVPTPAGVPIGVSYSVDGTKCSWGAVGGPLAAGATVTIGSQGGSCVIPDGTHTITVFADDVNRMAETNKTNNTLSQTITIGGADLVPTSISYSSATGAFISVVSNQGAVPTPAGVPIGVSYSVDGTKCTWGAVDGPLAAGATVTIGSQGGSCVIPDGTHTITVFADDVNRMAESDETNNTLSQTITIGGAPLPDLVPTSISYSSATGAFTSVVSNQGGAPTPAGVPIGVSYSVDGTKCTWGAVDGPLAAGATVTIGSQGGSCVIPNGTHTITVFADDVHRMAESDKTNNTLSQTIAVP